MKYYITDNTAPAVPLSEIPEASYAEFYADLAAKLADARYHIAHYFALPLGDRLRFFCLLLDDTEAKVLIASHAMEYYDEQELPSLTALHPQVHPFERDIAERYGVRFDGMPWPTPPRSRRRSRNSRAASPPHGSVSNAPWRSNWNGWRCRSPTRARSAWTSATSWDRWPAKRSGR